MSIFQTTGMKEVSYHLLEAWLHHEGSGYLKIYDSRETTLLQLERPRGIAVSVAQTLCGTAQDVAPTATS